MNHRSLTVRTARWSATHPWRALILWVAFVAAAVGTMSVVSTEKVGYDDTRIGQSGVAAGMIEDAGLAADPTESVIIRSRSGALDTDQATAAAQAVDRAVSPVKGVKDVGPQIASEDGTALLVPITMTGTPDDAGDHVQGVLDATAEVQKAYPGLRVEQAGSASLDVGINDKVGSDLGSAEALSLPITFLILLVAFGALIAAGIPVLLAISSVFTALGLYAPISHLVPDSGTVANVVLLIGMAVGVDYSLFYLKREREERERGRSTIDAIEIAAATSGRAVVVSGFAVMVAMSGLFLTRDVVFAGLAIGSILVVAVSVVGSLTVLPALLSKLGRYVDRPRVPLLWRLNRRIGVGGISGRLIRPVISHPRGAVVVAGGLLLALGIPALGMKMHQGTIDTLPQDIPAVAAYQSIQKSFPSEHPVVNVVVGSSSAKAQSALASVADQARSAGIAVVGEDAIRTRGNTSVLTMATIHPEGDPRNGDAVKQLRNTIVPRAVGDVKWAVGGDAAETFDYDNRPSTLPLVIAFVLGLTLIMMGWTFRSLTIAALTTVLNLLSVGASFGVMALVFQHSWADGLLDYKSSGFVIDWVPLFCFVILIGLSMDYHVFVLSRVREGLRNGLPYERAVEFGIRETASVVTSAAAVMVSVFAVFATLGMVEMKQMGIGLSVAILLDATLVRLVLLPALLLLFKGRLADLGSVKGDRAVEEEREPQYV